MNYVNDAPRLVPIVQSDTVNQPTVLLGVVVFAAGDLAFVTPESDTEQVRTFPDAVSGGFYPVKFWGRMKRINATGTTIADADLQGLCE